MIVSYARYSTDRQTEASIHDQQRVCREFAQRHGWSIDREFTDEGISGAALGNRPGVQAAMAALDAGGVLLLADTTRLSRSQELAPLIDRLRFRGVRVIGVLDGFDSDSAHARMQAGLSGLMSDELRANIRARTHSALQMRASQARPTGGKAYGFDAAGQPVEAEAEIVREVFARVSDGETLRAIASDLNTRGVPSPGSTWNRETRRKDGRWLVSTLHEMLRNERYAGRWVWNRSRWVKDPDTGLRQRRERPRSEWIVREGPALIDPAQWQALQSRLAARDRAYGSPMSRPAYLLSGLLVCQECGRRLVVSGHRGSHYYCGSYRSGGPAACSVSAGARRDVAERLILEPVRQDLLSQEAIRAGVEFMRGLSRQKRTPVLADVAGIDAEIAELEGLIASRPALAAALAPALEAAHSRRTATQQAAWRRATAAPAHDDKAAEAAYRDTVGRMLEVLTGPVVAPARDALRALVGDVPVWQEQGSLWARIRLNIGAVLLAGPNGSGGVLWTPPARSIALTA